MCSLSGILLLTLEIKKYEVGVASNNVHMRFCENQSNGAKYE
jgi:hypothetical protein